MEGQFLDHLRDVMTHRLDETLEFGRTLSVDVLARYLNDLFGESLFPCSTQKMVARYVEGLVLVKRNGTDEYWSARRVRQVLREVHATEHTCPSPLEGIRTTLYVTPTLFRPYRKIPGYAYKADGLTDLYAKIVHANKKLVAFETRDSRLRVQVCFRCAQSYQHLY